MSRYRSNNNARGYSSKEEVEDFDDFQPNQGSSSFYSRSGSNSYNGGGAGNAYGGTGGHHNLTTTAERTRIADLSILVTSFPVVVGTVVWKSEPKTFQNRRGPAGAESGKVSMVLRDDEHDTLSLTIWADSPDAIETLDADIKEGDIIVANGKIHQKKDQTDMYSPGTTSSFEMSVSIGSESSVVKYDPAGSNIVTVSDSELAYLENLTRQPLGYHEGFLKLADICRESERFQYTGQTANILCVVGRVSPPREITFKNGGRTTLCCNVTVLDETCPSFELTIFGRSGAEAAQLWTPFETVLFLHQAKVTEFRGKVGAQISFKTVVTLNPDTPEAFQLFNYAASQAANGAKLMDSGAGGVDDNVDVSTLDKYVVEQVLRYMNGGGANHDGKLGAFVATLTHLNIDDDDLSLVCRMKCTKCGAEAQGGQSTCSCGAAGSMSWRYVLQVHFSDATGTITRCWLRPDAAASLLGFEASEFMGLPAAERTELKVRLLFEKYIVAFRLRSGGQGESVSILSCRAAEPSEIIAACHRLKTYNRAASDEYRAMEGV